MTLLSEVAGTNSNGWTPHLLKGFYPGNKFCRCLRSALDATAEKGFATLDLLVLGTERVA